LKFREKRFKLLCEVLIILNILSAVSGALYFILATTTMIWLWNLFSIIWLATWILNIIVIYTNNLLVIKSNRIGKKINRWGYYELIFIIISMGIFILNNLTSAYTASVPLTIHLFALLALIGMAVFGVILPYFDIQYITDKGDKP